MSEGSAGLNALKARLRQMELDLAEAMDCREEQGRQIAEMREQLASLRERKGREYRKPALDELRAEITAGPLAEQCESHWLDVFEPHPTLREKLRHREGMLKSDAAFAIHKILLSRAEELGWDLAWQDVLRAHRAQRSGR